MASIPAVFEGAVRCRCKIKLCAICALCPGTGPRCMCPHERGKQAKRRGEHGPRKSTLHKKTKRVGKRRTNTYKEGELAESPLVPRREQPKRGKYSTNVPVEVPTMAFAALSTPADLLKVFGMSDRVAHWYKHAPSLEARGDPSTWKGDLDAPAKLVARTVAQVAVAVCTILCDDQKLAGSLLWEHVLSEGRDRQKPPQQHPLAMTVASCFVHSRKSSTERRVLRACLTTFTREKEMDRLKTLVPGLTMTPRSFSRGRNDLESLRLGASLTQTVRSVQRLEPRVVDVVVSSILDAFNISFLSWGHDDFESEARFTSSPQSCAGAQRP